MPHHANNNAHEVRRCKALTSSSPSSKDLPRNQRKKKRTPVVFPKSSLSREQAHEIIVCVDDTDDISATTSTGYIAELLAQEICQLGGIIQLGITRHQLFLGQAVKYTSHNSAMCFSALVPVQLELTSIHQRLASIVEKNAVPDADPGLCILKANRELQSELMDFGIQAKRRLCTKNEAYALASKFGECILSEHGGTGEGVIGALAGCGLRLSGADGRFRGTWRLKHMLDVSSDFLEAHKLCTCLSSLIDGLVQVLYDNEQPLAFDVAIDISQELKPILQNNALTVVCHSDLIYSESTQREVAQPLRKADLGSLGNGEAWTYSCERFVFDNDDEECSEHYAQCCGNCLYRRWTDQQGVDSGFICMADDCATPQDL